MTQADYRPEIDGLRAIAVIFVLLYHAGVPGFAGGYVGVDVFFVISGYLITGIILPAILAGRFSLAGFYERRARRILPALVATLILTTMGALLIMPPRLLAQFGKALVATALSVSNFHFWKSSSYFTDATELNPLIHTWSLAAEEQFYLVYPLALALLCRITRGRMVVPLAAAMIASLGLSVWAASNAPMGGFYLLPSRAWELLAGGLLTLLPARRIASRAAADAAAIAGLVMIAAATLTFNDATPFPGYHAVLPVIGSALIVATATGESRVGWLLSRRPIVQIGLVSYSLYLVHQPILALMRVRAVQPLAPVETALALILSVVLAFVSWRFIEQPFRGSRGLLRQRRTVFATSAAALASVAVIGIGLSGSHGLPQRFDPVSIASLDADAAAESRLDCLRGYHSVDTRPCVIGTAAAKTRFALVGDSHAWQLIPALQDIANRRGWRFDVYSKAACPPARMEFVYAAIRRRYDECQQWLGQLPLHDGAYDAVMLTASGRGYRINHPDPISPERWRSGLDDNFAALQRAGVNALWLLDTPRFETFDPRLCVERARLAAFPALADCTAPTQDVLDQALRSVEIAAAGARRVGLIDLAAPLCPGGSCSAAINGVPALRDDNHLSAAGALRLAPVIEAGLVAYSRLPLARARVPGLAALPGPLPSPPDRLTGAAPSGAPARAPASSPR